MATRTKVLVVDQDLDTLSKIYLALVHRNFKAEASDKASEIPERMKRFKPSLLILGKNEYGTMKNVLKIPAIVIALPEELLSFATDSGVIFLEKPFSVEVLMRSIGELVI